MSQTGGKIRVEITDASEFHCFRLVFNPRSAASVRSVVIRNDSAGEPPDQIIEIMLHARALVDLIHEASKALCEWQGQTTSMLIQRITGFSEEEARQNGLIA